MRQAILGEEHVLGAAQPDAFGAERARLKRIARNVGVGAHAHSAEWLGPAHQLLQLGIVRSRRHRVQLAVDYAAGDAVERNPIALLQRFAVHAHDARLLIHFNVTGARDAALAHAARHHRRVAGHAAARGENAGSDFHAGNVLGSGFAAHQNQFRLTYLC